MERITVGTNGNLSQAEMTEMAWQRSTDGNGDISKEMMNVQVRGNTRKGCSKKIWIKNTREDM